MEGHSFTQAHGARTAETFTNAVYDQEVDVSDENNTTLPALLLLASFIIFVTIFTNNPKEQAKPSAKKMGNTTRILHGYAALHCVKGVGYIIYSHGKGGSIHVAYDCDGNIYRCAEGG